MMMIYSSGYWMSILYILIFVCDVILGESMCNL